MYSIVGVRRIASRMASPPEARTKEYQKKAYVQHRGGRGPLESKDLVRRIQAYKREGRKEGKQDENTAAKGLKAYTTWVNRRGDNGRWTMERTGEAPHRAAGRRSKDDGRKGDGRNRRRAYRSTRSNLHKPSRPLIPNPPSTRTRPGHTPLQRTHKSPLRTRRSTPPRTTIHTPTPHPHRRTHPTLCLPRQGTGIPRSHLINRRRRRRLRLRPHTPHLHNRLPRPLTHNNTLAPPTHHLPHALRTVAQVPHVIARIDFVQAHAAVVARRNDKVVVPSPGGGGSVS